MTVKRIDLAWIVVKDIKKAIEYYTHTVGLKLQSYNEQFGWAELCGQEGGSLLGIAQMSPKEPVQPGTNAILTMSVQNISHAKEELMKKGAVMEGEIMEIPNVVKLQMVKDADGNRFQLVETFQ